MIFFLLGASMASWVVRTPAIRDALSASTGRMGLVLFGLSIGSMTGILASGLLVRRFGTKSVIAMSTALVIAGISVLGVATTIGSTWSAFAGLMLFGLGMGCSEIAINVDGADVERAENRPLLPLLHGTFSAGTVVGSLLGLGLTHIGVGVMWHLLGVTVAAVIATVLVLPSIPGGFGVEHRGPRRGFGDATRQQFVVWSERRVVLIGCVVLGMALAEGAANDWLALLVVDAHGYSPTAGSLIFTVFAASMTAGRFLGGKFVSRFGRTPVVRTSALCTALGIVLVISTSQPAIAVAGVVLWGLGGSLGFPLAISAAGDGGGDAAMRVSAVATAGYIAFLVGPPLLGFLGEHFGLQRAMIVVVALACCAAATASAVRPRPGN
ncbi:MFS transporter [Saccharopolyspora karakumensis]|nr:MFS transporter [Saccharopolyspora karakumensis]